MLIAWRTEECRSAGSLESGNLSATDRFRSGVAVDEDRALVFLVFGIMINYGEEFVELNGFTHITIHTGLEAELFITAHGVGGHGNDWDGALVLLLQ